MSDDDSDAPGQDSEKGDEKEVEAEELVNEELQLPRERAKAANADVLQEQGPESQDTRVHTFIFAINVYVSSNMSCM